MGKDTSDKEKERGKQKRRKGKRVVRGKRNKAGKIIVSGTMLMEVETILQTQVVIKYYFFLLVLCFLLCGSFLYLNLEWKCLNLGIFCYVALILFYFSSMFRDQLLLCLNECAIKDVFFHFSCT